MQFGHHDPLPSRLGLSSRSLNSRPEAANLTLDLMFAVNELLAVHRVIMPTGGRWAVGGDAKGVAPSRYSIPNSTRSATGSVKLHEP